MLNKGLSCFFILLLLLFQISYFYYFFNVHLQVLPIVLKVFSNTNVSFAQEFQAREKTETIQTPLTRFERFLHLDYSPCYSYVHTSRITILVHGKFKDYDNSHILTLIFKR